MPRVGIIMGSQSDHEVMKDAGDVMKEFDVDYEIKVVSAHRTPKLMYEYAEKASSRGIEVIIAGAGGSAHLPGMVASITTLPVIGEDFHKFVDESDVVTFEFEHINRDLLKYADSQGKLRPSFKSVELKMERHKEKLYLREHGYPLGDFEVCNSSSEAIETANKYDNYVIKKSEGGYDGKGQFYKNKMNGFPENDSSVFVVEKFVDFQYEASIISIRDYEGRKYSYDPSYTLNKSGILIKNNSPLIDQDITAQMRDIAFRLMDDLDYIHHMTQARAQAFIAV